MRTAMHSSFGRKGTAHTTCMQAKGTGRTFDGLQRCLGRSCCQWQRAVPRQNQYLSHQNRSSVLSTANQTEAALGSGILESQQTDISSTNASSPSEGSRKRIWNRQQRRLGGKSKTSSTTLQQLSDTELQTQMQKQVLQVRTLHRLPNYHRPWEGGTDVQSTCTAFVLDTNQRLLLTTAGAVEGARKIFVQRSDDETEYPATIAGICVDADVAILRVEDNKAHLPKLKKRPSQAGRFWAGLLSTEWAPLPQLQDGVRVAGYPIGGDTLCVTSGVVSRCEVLEYSHSNRNLLALQVDAPLNNGVWGGPVYDKYGRVLGMAFQKFSTQTWMERYDEAGLDDMMSGPGGDDSDDDDDEADNDSGYQGGGEQQGDGPPGELEADEDTENIGQVVPATLLAHVVQQWQAQQQRMEEGDDDNALSVNTQSAVHIHHQDDRNSTVVHPLPSLGIRWQALQSAALRKHLGMTPHQTGVRIAALDPGGSAASCLETGDVLMSLGGYDIANDGTVILRPMQRVLFSHAIECCQPNDNIPATVLRDGQQLQLNLRLCWSPPILPTSLGLTQPLYMICGGAVLLQLTVPFMFSYQPPKSPRRKLKNWKWGHVGVVAPLEYGLAEQAGGEQIIIMSELLGGSVAHDGYDSDLGAGIRRLIRVNGQRVLNMSQLARIIVECTTNTTPNTACSQQDHHDTVSQQDDEGSSHIRSDADSSSQIADKDSSIADTTHEGATTGAQGDGEQQSYVTLEFADGSIIVLDAATLKMDTQAALAHQGIQHAMSGRLRDTIPGAESWPRDDSEDQARIGIQKRQKKRRLAIRR